MKILNLYKINFITKNKFYSSYPNFHKKNPANLAGFIINFITRLITGYKKQPTKIITDFFRCPQFRTK